MVRALIAESTVGSNPVVVLSPIFNDDARFAQIQQELSVQTFISKSAVETFDVAVLPRTAWIDIDRLDPVFSEPLLDFACDKFRAVIAADIGWNSMLHHRLPKRGQDLVGG